MAVSRCNDVTELMRLATEHMPAGLDVRRLCGRPPRGDPQRSPVHRIMPVKTVLDTDIASTLAIRRPRTCASLHFSSPR